MNIVNTKMMFSCVNCTMIFRMRVYGVMINRVTNIYCVFCCPNLIFQWSCVWSQKSGFVDRYRLRLLIKVLLQFCGVVELSMLCLVHYSSRRNLWCVFSCSVLGRICTVPFWCWCSSTAISLALGPSMLALSAALNSVLVIYLPVISASLGSVVIIWLNGPLA